MLLRNAPLSSHSPTSYHTLDYSRRIFFLISLHPPSSFPRFHYSSFPPEALIRDECRPFFGFLLHSKYSRGLNALIFPLLPLFSYPLLHLGTHSLILFLDHISFFSVNKKTQKHPPTLLTTPCPNLPPPRHTHNSISPAEL